MADVQRSPASLLLLLNRSDRRCVAPFPASRLLNNEGLLAHTYACSDDTVNTPRLFSMAFVFLETHVKRPLIVSTIAREQAGEHMHEQ